jgi:peptidoglycan biosynthesis protein MviN/MurJ (putative lipid II flippase)
VLVIVAGEWLFALMLAGSGVAAADIALAADMMALLGGYMLAVLMGIVSAQVYYCCGETRRVALYSTVVVTLGVPVKLLGLWQFGVPGLVAGISLSWLLNVAWFWWKVPVIFADVARRPRGDAAGLAADVPSRCTNP